MNASERIKENRERIINEWAARVRQAIPPAKERPYPELVDTLPNAVDNVAEMLDSSKPRGMSRNSDTRALAHGAERARLTAYSLANVIEEYNIFREVILDVLSENGGRITKDELHIIRTSISDAIKDSAAGFIQEQTLAREQFILALSHDLRNPLTAAKASIELIMRYPDQRERHHALAAKAVENLNRMDTMIRNLLDVSRIQAGESIHLDISRFDLKSLIEQTIEEFKVVHGERFLFHAPHEPVEGYWDSEALKRCLENLLSNAIKYGKRETPVTVKLSITEGSTFVHVHNEGNPISIDDQKSLFAMHRRVQTAIKSGKKGWGLGLAFVKGVTEAHGGSLVIESSEHKGTTMIMNFPCDSRPYQKY